MVLLSLELDGETLTMHSLYTDDSVVMHGWLNNENDFSFSFNTPSYVKIVGDDKNKYIADIEIDHISHKPIISIKKTIKAMDGTELYKGKVKYSDITGEHIIFAFDDDNDRIERELNIDLLTGDVILSKHDVPEY